MLRSLSFRLKCPPIFSLASTEPQCLIMEGLATASNKFLVAYKRDTPTNLKIVDIYLAYIMLSGIFQFIYMLAAGTFPYNAFLSGFISTVGSFVLAGT